MPVEMVRALRADGAADAGLHAEVEVCWGD